MSENTVQSQIRLLFKEQSDQGIRCLPFRLYLLETLRQYKTNLFTFRINMTMITVYRELKTRWQTI